MTYPELVESYAAELVTLRACEENMHRFNSITEWELQCNLRRDNVKTAKRLMEVAWLEMAIA